MEKWFIFCFLWSMTIIFGYAAFLIVVKYFQVLIKRTGEE